MFNNTLLQATSAKSGSSVLELIIFALDYIIFPVFGIILLIIVFRLIKSKKIVVNTKDDQN